MKTKKCKFCDKEFEPTKPKQVFCSTKCRTYEYRLNHIADQADVLVAEVRKDEPKSDWTEVKKKLAAKDPIKKLQNFVQPVPPLVSGVSDQHPLWKPKDPKEGSMAFYLKYGCNSYAELEKKM